MSWPPPRGKNIINIVTNEHGDFVFLSGSGECYKGLLPPRTPIPPDGLPEVLWWRRRPVGLEGPCVGSVAGGGGRGVWEMVWCSRGDPGCLPFTQAEPANSRGDPLQDASWIRKNGGFCFLHEGPEGGLFSWPGVAGE